MLRKYIIVLLLVLIVPVTGNAAGTAADDARDFVDNIGKKVLGVINTPGGSKSEKQQQLRQMFSENVDVPWMGQFVLARAWQQLSPEQRDRYLKPYREYMLTRYTTRFTDYTGAKYEITDVKSESDGQFTVNMQIKAPQQTQETLAGYRIRKDENNQFKIVDIIIEGVSLINTQRSEFAAVIQQKNIEGLIEDLENKTTSEKQKPTKDEIQKDKSNK